MNTLDPRLLAVFNEIYKSRSVSAAALTLGLAQPAVSIALARLRRQLGDPLFVRTSRGMEPTPFGEGLVQPVRAVLDAMDQVLGHRNAFDPATADRLFRLCMTDISQLVLLPRLWAAVRESAPGIHFEILPLSDDTGRLLESGAADLALGYMPALEAGFYQQTLFRQGFVCMVSASHPRIGAALSLAEFEAEDHVVVSAAGPAPLLIEREVERLGIRRRIAVRIPSYLGAAFMVERTDHLMTIPRRLAQVLEGRGSFRFMPAPFELPGYDIKQHWHERYHHDPGSRWLRDVISALLTQTPQIAP